MGRVSRSKDDYEKTGRISIRAMEHQLTSIAFGAVVKDLGDCWQPRRPERLNQEGIGCGGETYVARDQRTRASAIRSQERRRLRSSASAVAAKRFAGIATRSENGADPLLLAASAPNSREAHSEQTRRPRDHPRPHPPRAPPNKPSVRRPCRRLGSRTRRTGGASPRSRGLHYTPADSIRQDVHSSLRRSAQRMFFPPNAERRHMCQPT
jgi:hypothetical protein